MTDPSVKAGTDANPSRPLDHDKVQAYWRANLSLMSILLVIWFTVSFGFGILFRDILDQISIGGAPLGFWFAQQGAIISFIILIFVYVVRMSALDKKFQANDNEGGTS